MKSFIELKAQAALSVEDIVKLYSSEAAPIDSTIAREEELAKLSKEDLIKLVVSLERNVESKGIVALTERMLQDESLITTPHTVLAAAINKLIPGATSTNKSVASIYSKGKDKGLLPRL